MRASQGGYFAEFQPVYVRGDMRLDFRLQRAVRIAVGELVKGRVTREDPICDPNYRPTMRKRASWTR